MEIAVVRGVSLKKEKVLNIAWSFRIVRAHAADRALAPLPPARVQFWETLQQRLRELGYLEGQNIAFESRFAEGKTNRLPGHAVELVRLKVDVIVTSGTPATLAAKQATLTIPIVMPQLADPVGAGLVASLSRPGGNVTGLTTQDADLSGKRLGLLGEVVPNVSRIALLIEETNPGTVLIEKGTQAAARSVGVQLQSLIPRLAA